MRSPVSVGTDLKAVVDAVEATNLRQSRLEIREAEA
jgi:hypothetical protein